LLGVLYYGILPKVFHQSFSSSSFFLSSLLCGASEHTPFFHNTPFQFDHIGLEKVAFLLPLLDMNPKHFGI
jgi:hypothetical protein